MSEDERLRRREYKRNRRKWILIQAIALAVVMVLMLTSFAIYDKLNDTYYIEYTENGSVDYKVNLKENSFFDQPSVGAGQSYIASLIENIPANFKYHLAMDNATVGFEYTYWINAQLIIANKDTEDHIYDPTFELVPETTVSVSNRDSLDFGTSVNIDYNRYNKIANDFISAYGLKGATSILVVTMNVKVLSTCDEFQNQSNQNTYFSALNIPLTVDNFSMFTTSSNPESTSKVLACKGGAGQLVFLILTLVFVFLAFAQAVVLVVFIFITKNEDVTYTNKVRKILSSYRSFIQQIEGQFNTKGYQVVILKTFKEMLSIRDTIQSPILMFENIDQTVTEFVIPTNTDVIYMFEIKVDNYDAIYGIQPEPVPVPEEITMEEIESYDDGDEELETGVEVVSVVWTEKEKRDKVYRYDPNGMLLNKGDIVLAPTMDREKNREVVRKAAIVHGNHRIDPATHPHHLKKIIGVIKRHMENALSSTSNSDE